MDDSGSINCGHAKELFFKTVEKVLSSDLRDIGAQCDTLVELDMSINQTIWKDVQKEKKIDIYASLFGVNEYVKKIVPTLQNMPLFKEEDIFSKVLLKHGDIILKNMFPNQVPALFDIHNIVQKYNYVDVNWATLLNNMLELLNPKVLRTDYILSIFQHLTPSIFKQQSIIDSVFKILPKWLLIETNVMDEDDDTSIDVRRSTTLCLSKLCALIGDDIIIQYLENIENKNISEVFDFAEVILSADSCFCPKLITELIDFVIHNEHFNPKSKYLAQAQAVLAALVKQHYEVLENMKINFMAWVSEEFLSSSYYGIHKLVNALDIENLITRETIVVLMHIALIYEREYCFDDLTSLTSNNILSKVDKADFLRNTLEAEINSVECDSFLHNLLSDFTREEVKELDISHLVIDPYGCIQTLCTFINIMGPDILEYEQDMLECIDVYMRDDESDVLDAFFCAIQEKSSNYIEKYLPLLLVDSHISSDALAELVKHFDCTSILPKIPSGNIFFYSTIWSNALTGIITHGNKKAAEPYIPHIINGLKDIQPYYHENHHVTRTNPLIVILHDHFGRRDELRKIDPVNYVKMFKFDMNSQKKNFADIDIKFSVEEEEDEIHKPQRKKRKIN